MQTIDIRETLVQAFSASLSALAAGALGVGMFAALATPML